MGRVPKATISLMYWNARLESIWGSGPESGGAPSLAGAAAGSGAGTLAPVLAFSAGVDEDPLLQAVVANTNTSMGKRKLNHRGHRGPQMKSLRIIPGVFPLFNGFMVPLWSSVLPVVKTFSRWLRLFLLCPLLALRGMHK